MSSLSEALASFSQTHKQSSKSVGILARSLANMTQPERVSLLLDMERVKPDIMSQLEAELSIALAERYQETDMEKRAVVDPDNTPQLDKTEKLAGSKKDKVTYLDDDFTKRAAERVLEQLDPATTAILVNNQKNLSK